MSIDLMVEVLDHYHGPHSRKLWLLAWAEKVSNDGGSRTGYCKRTILAERLGVSPARASRIARELEVEGVIKRLGGGVWGKTAVFELLPLDAAQGNSRGNPTQGNPRGNPTDAPKRHAQGNPRSNAQGNPRSNAQGNPRGNPNPHNPDNPDKPSALAPDLRMILRGLLGDLADDEIDFIIAKIEARPDTPDTAGYLLDQIGKDNGERFIKWARKLGVDDRPYCDDPRCDHGWLEIGDALVKKCPNRHRDSE